MTDTLTLAEIYSKPNCPYCVKAKALLEKHNIPYREISAVDEREVLIERVEAAIGQPPKTVPQIFIDGRYIGGHDQLVIHLGA
jgi:glutaredoxin 3